MQNSRELKESGGIQQGLAARRGRAGARAGLPSMLGNGNVSDGAVGKFFAAVLLTALKALPGAVGGDVRCFSTHTFSLRIH